MYFNKYNNKFKNQNQNLRFNDNKFKNQHNNKINPSFLSEKNGFIGSTISGTQCSTTLGDELNYNLKLELLNYIYDSIDLYQLRYCIMKTQDHAQQLKQQSYHITSHFHGYNYFLIFKKLSDGIMGVYLVYRMDLCFNKSDLKINNIKIYKLNIDNNIDINKFNNTIIDGKLVIKKEIKLFLISDILYYKGNKLLTIKIIDKFDKMDNDMEYLNNLVESTFELKFIKIYNCFEMNDLVYNKIKNSDFKINGLIFFPQRSGKILIYINDNEFENIKTSPNLEISTNITNIKLPNNILLDKKTLLLQKTLSVDVYEVYDIDKTCRFGICSVPTIDLSHKLRKYFDTNDQLIIECEFDNKFNKWKPLF